MQIPEFMLTQTCTIKPYVGETASGPSYGIAYESKCRHETMHKKWSNDKGEEVVGNGRLFLPPSQTNLALAVGTEVTIDGVTYLVIDMALQRSFRVSHIECTLK